MAEMVPAPVLRIAVVGPGRIGSTFAFQLAHVGGHDVTVIARPDSTRLAQLRRDGAIVDTSGGRAVVHVADALDERTAYDLVIVTVLAHQLDTVLPDLKRSAAGCILFMFNTFDPGRLRDAVGARCALGMPFVQATLTGDGRLKATIGAGGQKSLLSDQRWVELFAAAKLPASLEPDMPLWLRCHAPMCVAFESVSIAAMRRGGGASWRAANVLARGVRASFGLIKALGAPIHPGSKRLFDRAPASVLAGMLWSVSRLRAFRELLATGEAESNALIDAMLAAVPLAGEPIDVAAIEAMRPR